MDEPNVTPLQRYPSEVSLTPQDRNVRFTPRELAAIKERYGRALSALVDDDESDDKLVVLAWLKLRREGWQLDLDDMLDIVVSLEGDGATDPTSGTPLTTSPPSAGSGA
jgi:hypothetical protein